MQAPASHLFQQLKTIKPCQNNSQKWQNVKTYNSLSASPTHIFMHPHISRDSHRSHVLPRVRVPTGCSFHLRTLCLLHLFKIRSSGIGVKGHQECTHTHSHIQNTCFCCSDVSVLEFPTRQIFFFPEVCVCLCVCAYVHALHVFVYYLQVTLDNAKMHLPKLFFFGNASSGSNMF